jgi:hypothetical protein
MRKPKYLDPKILHEQLAYDPKTGFITARHANKYIKAGHVYMTRTPGEYINVPYGKSQARAARAAWVLMTGEQPVIVDHINGIPHDNRWCNLRNVTVGENNRNRKSVRIKNGTYVPLE